ncbi:uncharacterized protein ACA1_056560 [Acanthamoeba castellanii str. Neff]|uniref:Uncharacterized protein n=1 Tax=Acanthamoeba castellanii (strain ATCC 30010 / Neff) TaxID=1257118 RepID=L8HFU6_ACACF|nr:uncharacterized protein ACA1_056560 [Acanthamoeba castellanii str. Neff]ELR24414.1 hypothetical protein ACA1_056560 [Acanthamoeba castellanii str. Neff]
MQHNLCNAYWFGVGGCTITSVALGIHTGYMNIMDNLPKHDQHMAYGFFSHVVGVVLGASLGATIGCCILSTTYWFGFGGFAITGAMLGTRYGYMDAMDGLPKHARQEPSPTAEETSRRGGRARVGLGGPRQ